MIKRSHFIKTISLATLAMPLGAYTLRNQSTMKIGLVTYQWGKDWDLATIINNCEKSKVLGVELRTEHKHGVEPGLNTQQRADVKKRFQNSPVKLVGYGSNAEFDSADVVVLQKNISLAKDLLQLSHDVGGSGVKVKPNKFHDGIPHQQTLEQIGRSLNELGKFAENLGQKVRLEVHGEGTQELINIKAIMDVAVHPHVVVCWNCNPTDLNGNGFEYNFNLVKDRLGDTIHIHEINGNYPNKDLARLLNKKKFTGWLLLECTSEPADKVKAMTEQREAWEAMIMTA
ncbi:MAG: TIM barrel protein [Chitinophagaceae bacterium]